jgi:hypothetical protein
MTFCLFSSAPLVILNTLEPDTIQVHAVFSLFAKAIRLSSSSPISSSVCLSSNLPPSSDFSRAKLTNTSGLLNGYILRKTDAAGGDTALGLPSKYLLMRSSWQQVYLRTHCPCSALKPSR